MSQHYFTVAELRSNISPAALRALITPLDKSQRTVASHHVVWKLFGDSPDRKRDFLWREHKPGMFYVLSDRPPEDQHGLFDLRDPKEYAPSLADGDVLEFEVRTNATVARKQPDRKRGKRSDVVMHALTQALKDATPAIDKSALRKTLIDGAALGWMEKQGAAHGFEVRELAVQGYSVLRLDRGSRSERASLGVLDLRGRLRVTQPARFLETLVQGLGRGRAFGCGLMMIRRG